MKSPRTYREWSATENKKVRVRPADESPKTVEERDLLPNAGKHSAYTILPHPHHFADDSPIHALPVESPYDLFGLGQRLYGGVVRPRVCHFQPPCLVVLELEIDRGFTHRVDLHSFFPAQRPFVCPINPERQARVAALGRMPDARIAGSGGISSMLTHDVHTIRISDD